MPKITGLIKQMANNDSNTNVSQNDVDVSEMFFSSNLKLISAIMNYENDKISKNDLSLVRLEVMNSLGIPEQISVKSLEKGLMRLPSHNSN